MNTLPLSLINAGFRYGSSNKTTEQLKTEKVMTMLKKWDPGFESCACLLDGLSIDLREAVTCLETQDPTFLTTAQNSYQPLLSGNAFELIYDDDTLNRGLSDLMNTTQWRVKLKLKGGQMLKSQHRIVLKILLDEQDHPIFNAFPVLRSRLPSGCDVLFELGETRTEFDLYFEGNIYLAPKSLIIASFKL